MSLAGLFLLILFYVINAACLMFPDDITGKYLFRLTYLLLPNCTYLYYLISGFSCKVDDM